MGGGGEAARGPDLGLDPRGGRERRHRQLGRDAPEHLQRALDVAVDEPLGARVHVDRRAAGVRHRLQRERHVVQPLQPRRRRQPQLAAQPPLAAQRAQLDEPAQPRAVADVLGERAARAEVVLVQRRLRVAQRRAEAEQELRQRAHAAREEVAAELGDHRARRLDGRVGAEEARIARHELRLLGLVEQQDGAERALEDQLVRRLGRERMRPARQLVRVATRRGRELHDGALQHPPVDEAAQHLRVRVAAVRRRRLERDGLERQPQPQRVVTAEHVEQAAAQPDVGRQVEEWPHAEVAVLDLLRDAEEERAELRPAQQCGEPRASHRLLPLLLDLVQRECGAAEGGARRRIGAEEYEVDPRGHALFEPARDAVRRRWGRSGGGVRRPRSACASVGDGPRRWRGLHLGRWTARTARDVGQRPEGASLVHVAVSAGEIGCGGALDKGRQAGRAASWCYHALGIRALLLLLLRLLLLWLLVLFVC